MTVKEFHTSFLNWLTDVISSGGDIGESIGSERGECRACLALVDCFGGAKYGLKVLVGSFCQLHVLPSCNDFASGEGELNPAVVHCESGEARDMGDWIVRLLDRDGDGVGLFRPFVFSDFTGKAWKWVNASMLCESGTVRDLFAPKTENGGGFWLG